MPRIPQEWLDSIVYLYETKEQAKAGERVGATGFIVSLPADDPEIPEILGHHYVVTNRHCVEPERDLVARLNVRGGGFDVVDVPFKSWAKHPNDDDVTAAIIEPKPPAHQYASVNRGMILTRELLDAWDFGPGDEAFFIGRYVDLDGKAYNVPSVRSGIVSAYPVEPIYQPGRDHYQESFLVEARSLTGFSGSPVFVTHAARIEKSAKDGIDSVPTIKARDGAPVFLLGIDWGHHAWFENLLDENDRKLPQKFPTSSGMMKVVPAWKLREVLDCPRLVAVRKEREERVRKVLATSSVVEDFAEGERSEFERFEDLTRKLVQTPKPSGS